jgi:hypothetical protein
MLGSGSSRGRPGMVLNGQKGPHRAVSGQPTARRSSLILVQLPIRYFVRPTVAIRARAWTT